METFGVKVVLEEDFSDSRRCRQGPEGDSGLRGHRRREKADRTERGLDILAWGRTTCENWVSRGGARRWISVTRPRTVRYSAPSGAGGSEASVQIIGYEFSPDPKRHNAAGPGPIRERDTTRDSLGTRAP